MKQKTQYFILLILAAALIYTYTWDGIRVRDEAKEIQQRISTINEHLKSGAKIMNEMSEIRKTLLKIKIC